jgi:hypothetical protein
MVAWGEGQGEGGRPPYFDFVRLMKLLRRHDDAVGAFGVESLWPDIEGDRG